MSKRGNKLRLKVKNKSEIMSETKMSQEGNAIPSSQIEAKKPRFSKAENSCEEDAVKEKLNQLRHLGETKYKFETIKEGLNLAKATKRLPPYLRIEIGFTPALNEHETKAKIRNNLRQLRMDTIDNVVEKLIDNSEECINIIGGEMDTIVDEFEKVLDQSQSHQEKKEFFDQSNELINEFATRLDTYKVNLRKVPEKQEKTDRRPMFGKADRSNRH